MANEARVNSSTQIRQTVNGVVVQDYQARPTAQTYDLAAVGGPTPGEILATTIGTNVDLSQLSSPGPVRIQNMDSANYVEVGIWDPDTTEFLPLFELLPGKFMDAYLSRYLGRDISGTGTGTTSTGTGNRLRIKGIGASCKVKVEAFER